eukprot:scaffold449_cov241-Pinguiococcus_pyrenoidosus.AAC.6
MPYRLGCRHQGLQHQACDDGVTAAPRADDQGKRTEEPKHAALHCRIARFSTKKQIPEDAVASD